MKRGLVLFGLILFGVNSVASAQELGNPARLIPAKQFSVGVQGTWIFDQDFGDYDLGWTNSDGSAGTTRKSTTFENDQCYMATITYGLIDRVNLFARLGVVNGGEFKESSPGNEWKASLGTNFVWAIGAKGKVYELKNGIGFGVSAQYLRYDDRTLDSWKDVTDGITAEQDGWSTDDNVDYWQVDAIATVYWTIDRFTYGIIDRYTPYAGAGYSYSRVTEKGLWTSSDGVEAYDATFTNDNKFSALVGIDVDLGKHFTANVQGTFVSRTALTLGISYAF